jgi:hypothetical protein
MRPLIRLRVSRVSPVSSLSSKTFLSIVSRIAMASFCLTLPAIAFANGSHHSSGSGSGGSEGPCIRWEKNDSGAASDASSDAARVVADASLDAAARDADANDAESDASLDADVDADVADAAPSPSPPATSSGGDLHVGETCVEHAGVFGCAIGPARSSEGGAGPIAFASLAALVAWIASARASARRRRG